MKKYMFIVAIFLILIACATNPFTGEKTMALVPDSQIFPSAFAQYGQFLAENKVLNGTKDAVRVEAIGTKIRVAAEKWLAANGQPTYLKNYQWEYKLIDSKEVNAWCMPGGKIVVYTGILPIMKDDSGMAAVMGHEVAHALANHGQQRMSAGMLQQLGGVAVGVAVGGKSQQTQEAIIQAYGIGSQVGGMLPFSRNHESEADSIGLTLMAIAGYDPESAVLIWERMSASSKGGAPSEIMSTHPSNETRIANLRNLIPNAKSEAKKFGVITFKQ